MTPTTPPPTTSAEADTVAEPSDEAALAEVLDELSEINAMDAGAKELLMADLRGAKRENWPLIVRQFRSALAYRQQLAEREQRLATNTTQHVAKAATAAAVDTETAARARTIAQPVSVEIPPTGAFNTESHLTAVAPSTRSTLRAVAPAPPQILSAPPAVATPQPITQQASYVAAVATTSDWRQHLHQAIADLHTQVEPAPGSTDEVNEHMRLRLLQLLAGDEEGALAPIPGATAVQQDYWNKQLFAVSTFLDADRQPNDKQRAAGALLHLDQARAKLSELATLQIRKLAFVDSVDGYGAYEVHEATTFRPGEQVTLYAEIENFSSQSTKQGYRTVLGTSYEVVDENGKRIDNAQFPEVEDVCQNPRRDFHMQYTVTLPTRLPADTYELRLIITDAQSQKIGQASLPIEIAD